MPPDSNESRRELSSRYTPLYRWVIPAFLSIVAVIVVLLAAGIDGSGAPNAAEVLSALVIAALCVLLARWLDRAKRVWLDDASLIVYDYKNEAAIPLEDIASVEASRYLRPDRVTVRFAKPTIFGTKISFFPPRDGLGLGSEHPLAGELMQRSVNVRAGVA